MRHWNNGTDHRHSKSCCDKSSPARRTMTSAYGKIFTLLAFCGRNHRSPGNSPHKAQRPGALMCSLICGWINDWENNRDAGDLRHHRAHHDVTVMITTHPVGQTIALQRRHNKRSFAIFGHRNGYIVILTKSSSLTALQVVKMTTSGGVSDKNFVTRTRWRRVKTLGQHQVGVNLQSHAQHQLWISTWHIFHEFHKIMPSLSYPVSLVNQNVILVNISHWRLHMAWIMSLMST